MRRFVDQILSFTCRYLALTRLLLFLSEALRREKILVAFKYHRVTDRSQGDRGYLIYDIGIDHRAFEIQIEVIKKYFDVVSLHDYTAFVWGEKKPKKRAALLTFDDADSEFATHALPILTRKQCPSVVFAPTDFIDSEKRFWHLRVTNILSNVASDQWEQVRSQLTRFPKQVATVISESSVADDNRRGVTCRALAAAIDRMDHREVESVVGELEAVAGVSYTLGVACMNWGELAQALECGVAVESHTVTHRKLALLDTESVRTELTESKRVLEEKLGHTVTALCYPAGSFNDLVAEEAERAGYRIAFTTRQGLGAYALPANERFRLRRVDMYGDTRNQAELHLAKIALKRLLSVGLFG